MRGHLLLSLLTAACSEVVLVPDASQWEEADVLFRQDLRWQGADDAYSVDLGEGRVIWLFADSFIARTPGSTRTDSRMVRNSIGVQQGYDPRSADISFHFQEEIITEPTSFFPEETDGSWHWPGDGEKVGESLIVFLMNVHPGDGGLGFEVFGATPVLISNPSDDPSLWQVQRIETPEAPEEVVLGAATVMVEGDYLYAYSPAEDFFHNVYLARWPSSRAEVGDLSATEWWCGESFGDVSCAEPIFGDAQTEFTVHFEPSLERFVVIQTEGFGSTTIGKRSAPRPEGPWSPATTIFTPPESLRDDTFVYAAKAHPQLQGGGLALTYVANAADFFSLFSTNLDLYYPRFVNVDF
jgi:hypothetical protein